MNNIQVIIGRPAMKKIFLASLVFSLSLLSTASHVFALTLDTIGTSATTNGRPGTNWYYTSQNPTFTGTAGASTTVTIDIDGTEYTTTANASGTWSYSPTTLTTGDHPVTVNGDGTSFSFTIHIGQSVPAESTTTKGGQTSTTSALPVTGTVTNTLAVIGFGGIMILGGLKLRQITV